MKELIEKDIPCPNGILNCGDFSGCPNRVVLTGSTHCRLCFCNGGQSDDEKHVICKYGELYE